MLSRQTPSAQMISSYSLRQRQVTEPWATSLDLPLVDMKGDDHHMYKDTDDLASSTSDFVKRLYRMLEDRLYPNVVMWSPGGDAFVIKDVTDFTKNCLPRAFKHSNFASFVRQLNKYDFHKVKSTDAGVTGDQAWVFKHPQFRSGHLDGLEHIKRKAPTQRKPTGPGAAVEDHVTTVSDGSTRALQAQIDTLNSSHDHLRSVIERLEANHQATLRELVAMQRTVAQQDALIQTLLQHLLNTQTAGAQANMAIPSMPTPNFDDSLFNFNSPSPAASKASSNATRDSMNAYNLSMPMDMSPQSEGPIAAMTPMLSPSSEEPSPAKQDDTDEVAALFDQLGASGKHATAPVWCRAPRVLLVDDDAVSRTVSARFLQDVGCVYEAANDGIVAVEKMRSTKYDIVLMDIVMPHLDGISATARIRQFDMLTPIVSMTGNCETSDVVSYMSNGMTDVLIKPFSKDSLISLLDKHLAHLRADAQMNAQQKSSGFEFTDADYSAMLQQFINTNPESAANPKRPRDDTSVGDERSVKKLRYDGD